LRKKIIIKSIIYFINKTIESMLSTRPSTPPPTFPPTEPPSIKEERLAIAQAKKNITAAMKWLDL
jgi:hypothetical protein